MFQSISLLTPVSFDKFNNQLGHTLLEACDNLFSFDGKKAVVISPVISGKYYPVKFNQVKPAFLETILKIVCLITVVVPFVAIIGKVIFRLVYDFKIVPIRDLTSGEADQLKLAAKNGDLDQVRALTAFRRVAEKDRGEAVLDAATNGHLEVVQELIADKATIADVYREKAIVMSAQYGYLEIVKELLKGVDDITEIHRYEAEMKKYGRAYRPPRDIAVECAAEYGRLEIVKELLKEGEISERGIGLAIQAASQRGHLEIVRALLADGTPITELYRGQAVMDAAWKGHLDIVKELLPDGVEIPKRYLINATHLANANGYATIVAFLLSLKKE